MLNRPVLPLAAALALLAAPIQAQQEVPADASDPAVPAPETAMVTVTADTVLATVNGTEITAGNLILMRAQLPAQYQAYPDGVLLSGLLTQAVQQELLAAQAGDLSLIARLALDNERRSLRAGEAMDRISKEAVTDEALAAAYETTYANAEPVTEYHAAHILVETEEEARKIAADLADGADFAALARERSTGPSAPNSGDLGWFSAGTMVPEFEDALKDMQAGDVSEPVQTQFGWHVILLNETRIEEVPTLDEARQTLEVQVQRAAVEARLAELQEAGTINQVDLTTLDPAFLSNPALVQGD
ncbi:MAG: peptidylprolyl isomerase [Qingshengfaniella sp.]